MDPIQKSQRVNVLRSFYVGTEIQKAGSVVDLPMRTALSMRGANKVEFVADSTPLGNPRVATSPEKAMGKVTTKGD